jgi:hypothetical protein
VHVQANRQYVHIKRVQVHGLQRPILTKEALDLAIEFLGRACLNGERRPPDKATLQEGGCANEMHADTICVSHVEDDN